MYTFYDLLFSKFIEERIFSEKSRVLISLFIIIHLQIDVKVSIHEKYTHYYYYFCIHYIEQRNFILVHTEARIPRLFDQK